MDVEMNDAINPDLSTLPPNPIQSDLAPQHTPVPQPHPTYALQNQGTPNQQQRPLQPHPTPPQHQQQPSQPTPQVQTPQQQQQQSHPPQPQSQPPSRNSPHPASAPQSAPVHPNPHGSSTRVYLNQNVTPHLLEAMKHLATQQPDKPLKWLSEFLAQKSAEIEG
ncbi:hypothetical protein GQ43DRAFT_437914 [Delitschia confertaspora ATCC 74209]|uniref:Uncharacterized protein n=1 Tax=Delitschia confertaspora ATCC 74209 TaxID=1513339 RepID=A0A9P4JU96_9PLEO|nr:hypothetical protein GQ43DRAFT_437914 [Delitschia confertaspora ATCC 74209]